MEAKTREGRKKYSCKYPGCKTWYYSMWKGQNKCLHNMPRSHRRREMWKKALRIRSPPRTEDNRDPWKYYKICENHFKPEDYLNPIKHLLGKDAVPIAVNSKTVPKRVEPSFEHDYFAMDNDVHCLQCEDANLLFDGTSLPENVNSSPPSSFPSAVTITINNKNIVVQPMDSVSDLQSTTEVEEEVNPERIEDKSSECQDMYFVIIDDDKEFEEPEDLFNLNAETANLKNQFNTIVDNRIKSKEQLLKCKKLLTSMEDALLGSNEIELD